MRRRSRDPSPRRDYAPRRQKPGRAACCPPYQRRRDVRPVPASFAAQPRHRRLAALYAPEYSFAYDAARLLVTERHGLNATDQIGKRRVDQQVAQRVAVGGCD